jgi:transcriptional regulator with XRE-family HTH domain
MDKTIHSKQYAIALQLLRQMRVQKRVTQGKLASRLRESQSFVSKCERGERRIDLIEMRSFCRALQVPFLQFVKELELKLQR